MKYSFHLLSILASTGLIGTAAFAQTAPPFVFVVDAGADFFGQCGGLCWFGSVSFNSPCDQLSGSKKCCPFFRVHFLGHKISDFEQRDGYLATSRDSTWFRNL